MTTAAASRAAAEGSGVALRQRRRMPKPTVSLRWAAVLVGAIAIAVSAAGSWIPSLWGDEVATSTSAQRPLSSLLMMLGNVDAVHGSYYLAMHYWVNLVGSSPFALRLPSAIAVGLTVAAVVMLAGALTPVRVAMIAGVVCAVLPRMTYLGEEARSYAFSAAIAAWLSYLLIRLVLHRNPPKSLWIGYGVLLAVGIYLFLYLALLVLAHGVVLLLARSQRATFIRWACSVSAALVIALPVFILAFAERSQISYLVRYDQVSFTSITVSLWFGSAWFAALAWPLMAVGVVAGLRGGGRRRLLVSVATAWLVIPGLVLILGQAVYPAFTSRYLSFCAPAAALLIACGVQCLARYRRGFGACVVMVLPLTLVLLALPSYLSQRTPNAKNGSDFAEISSVIGANAQVGDAVVFDRSVQISKKPRLALDAYPAGFVGVKDVMLDVPYARNTTWFDSTYSVAQANELGRFHGVDRVWLVDYSTTDLFGAVHAGTYGVSDLEALGFQQTSVQYATHHSVIREFTR